MELRFSSSPAVGFRFSTSVTPSCLPGHGPEGSTGPSEFETAVKVANYITANEPSIAAFVMAKQAEAREELRQSILDCGDWMDPDD
jgi:hypothetical protein